MMLLPEKEVFFQQVFVKKFPQHFNEHDWISIAELPRLTSRGISLY